MNINELKNELTSLGLFDKAKEIYTELGGNSVLSFIKSSHRLLSKVYHPDLNPANMEKANLTQQKLNKVGQLIKDIKDDEIVELFRSEYPEEENRKKKILVVEDEFGLQDIFKDIFMMEGYDVRTAVDGLDGYEIFKKFNPDLVFTDVVMPKMNGLELVKKIRETRPDIKVIYISGFFGIKRIKKDLDEEIIKYGCPTLAKPFKTSDLLHAVNNYLAD